MKNKKGLHILIFVIMAALLLSVTGCGSNSGTAPANTPNNTALNNSAAEPNNSEPAPKEPAEKTTVTFWNGFTGPDGELLKQIIDEYNANNTDNVEVKMDIMPWDQLFQKLPPAIATQTAPNMVAMWPGAARPYIENESFLPLDDFFTVTGADESNFVESSLEFGQSRTGIQYQLPMQTNGIYLFWNKKLFEEAGLDPEKGPATWEELAEFAEKITDADKNQFGMGFPIAGSPQYLAPLLKSNGGDVVDLENLKSVLNSPENIETMKWLQDLTHNKKVTPSGATGADMDRLMLGGQLGMFITGPWLVGGLKANNIDFGVSMPPAGSDSQFIEVDGIGFSVPEGTTEQQKNAVYKFIKYWSSDEIVKKWSLANGFPPFLKSVLNDPDIQADPLVSALSQMGDAGQPFLKGLITADRVSLDILFPMAEAVMAGQDVAEVVEKASNQIDEVLKSEP
jgi:multiple sugar transport system substrate-binding protein